MSKIIIFVFGEGCQCHGRNGYLLKDCLVEYLYRCETLFITLDRRLRVTENMSIKVAFGNQGGGHNMMLDSYIIRSFMFVICTLPQY